MHSSSAYKKHWLLRLLTAVTNSRLLDTFTTLNLWLYSAFCPPPTPNAAPTPAPVSLVVTSDEFSDEKDTEGMEEEEGAAVVRGSEKNDVDAPMLDLTQ